MKKEKLIIITKESKENNILFLCYYYYILVYLPHSAAHVANARESKNTSRNEDGLARSGAVLCTC